MLDKLQDDLFLFDCFITIFMNKFKIKQKNNFNTLHDITFLSQIIT